jgi:hypothetical protein
LVKSHQFLCLKVITVIKKKSFIARIAMEGRVDQIQEADGFTRYSPLNHHKRCAVGAAKQTALATECVVLSELGSGYFWYHYKSWNFSWALFLSYLHRSIRIGCGGLA